MAQSGCVGLASSLAFLFVLGAGETIFLEDSDGVEAACAEGGLGIRLGTDGHLALRAPPAEAEALVALINGRAARRAALRRLAAAACSSTDSPALGGS